MNKRKISILLILVAALLILSSTILYINQQNEKAPSYDYTVNGEDGTQVNNSEELKKTKYYEDLEIKNVNLIHYPNDVNNLEITVYNPTDIDKFLGDVTVELLDNAGNTIAILYGYLPEIKAKEEFKTTLAATNVKVVDAYNLKIYKEELPKEEDTVE